MTIFNKNDLRNALVNMGADAYSAETDGQIDELYDIVSADGVVVTEIEPDDEDFFDICERLDLNEKNNPTKVYRAHAHNQESVYFALDEDWGFE